MAKHLTITLYNPHNFCDKLTILFEMCQDRTRVKLAVSSPSQHFRDLAKKPPTQKRADKLKKNLKKHIVAKSYYKQLGRIISNDF